MKNNGGPAFPAGTAYQGMTLRDYFAAKAMQTKTFSVRPYDDTEQTAHDAYRMADAMLKARER